MNRYISIYPHLRIYLKSKIYYRLSYENIAQRFSKYEFQLSVKIVFFELPCQRNDMRGVALVWKKGIIRQVG